MHKFEIPYGKSFITFNLDNKNSVDLILPKENYPKKGQESNIVKKALSNCLGKDDRFFFDKNEHTVAISVNDPTRPIPYHYLLPLFLDKLDNVNISSENITFFIATGTHKGLSKDEIDELLSPKIASKYRTIVHNCDKEEQLTYLGNSTIGTPIYINSEFYMHDIKVVIGHIEPHHFMGFSGGVKSAVIGLGGRKTIEANHRLISDKHAKMGRFHTNPMRKDIEEIGKIIGIDLALNVVLNSKKNIIDAFFGNPYLVMSAGIESSKNVCEVNNEETYDLVIASPGGYPKDINLYQSQKAITHACLYLNRRGIVILVAECADGAGSNLFKEYFNNKNNYDEVISTFEKGEFQIGPHKAYQLALQEKEHPIFLISEMDPQIVNSMFITPVNNIKEAMDISKNLLPKNPKIAVLPFATHIMRPSIENK